MGASFRNSGEITELAGCDLLTIAPSLLDELAKKDGTLEKRLDASKAPSMDIAKIAMDEKTFREMHDKDRMAKEKLAEGIEGFSKAIAALEKQLTERFDSLENVATAKKGLAAHDMFKVYDLDGDGFITREEWGGTTAVFEALDVDHDGRITPEEMAAGLGAAFRLQA
jgi:transaldolase